VTEAKTIKISKETYLKLSELAGKLQIKLKRPTSLEEAMRYLLNIETKEKGMKLTDLAGSWSISDEELEEINAALAEAWKRWKMPNTKS